MFLTDDVRIDSLRPLLPPAILMEELPLPESTSTLIGQSRSEVEAILDRRDDRLLVVVGPCSVHDTAAGLVYAQSLADAAQRFADDLRLVMRVYFEKPRTTVGWKGLINDPERDGSFEINRGLRKARGFLLDVNALGLPCGCEFLDPITPQFFADTVSWGAIGARTTESQVHRELASGLSMPVGFKNGTGGTIQIAVDAVRAASHPHRFLSVTKQGLAAIVATKGNPHCHVILRGGASGTNFHPEAIADTVGRMEKAGVQPRVMVDCSHANSGKDHTRQPAVAEAIGAQVAAGEQGIRGVMLESFLVDGHQPLDGTRFGCSVTDACMGWGRTEAVLEGLAQAARARRLG